MVFRILSKDRAEAYHSATLVDALLGEETVKRYEGYLFKTPIPFYYKDIWYCKGKETRYLFSFPELLLSIEVVVFWIDQYP